MGEGSGLLRWQCALFPWVRGHTSPSLPLSLSSSLPPSLSLSCKPFIYNLHLAPFKQHKMKSLSPRHTGCSLCWFAFLHLSGLQPKEPSEYSIWCTWVILDPFSPDKVKGRILLGFGAVHPSSQYLCSFLFSFQSGRKSPVQTPTPACPQHLPSPLLGEPSEAGACAKGRDPPLSELLSYWNVLCVQLGMD